MMGKSHLSLPAMQAKRVFAMAWQEGVPIAYWKALLSESPAQTAKQEVTKMVQFVG